MTSLAASGPPSHPGALPPAARAVGGPPIAPARPFWTAVKAIEMRLRFVVLMLGTGLFFGYWDTLANQFEKWRRPAAQMRAVADHIEYYCPMHPSVIAAASDHCPSCGMSLARRVRGTATALPEGVLSQ